MTRPVLRYTVPFLVVALALGCGDNSGDDGGAEPDAAGPATDAGAPTPDAGEPTADAGAPDAAPDDPLMPMFLRNTGLYSDFDNEVLAPGVREFAPIVELWSDGAVKKRWIQLPEGTQIDTSDMDFWVYPVGTRMWKEFVRDDVRVETRLMLKVATDDWFRMAYAWNADQSEATAAPDGIQNHLGTEHDVPSQRDCRKCHLRITDNSIGFTAISLDHAGTEGQLTLQGLIDEDLLSDPPAGAGPTYFPVPGNALEVDALSYLHVNCGNCQNPNSDLIRDNVVNLQMRLLVDKLGTIEETPTYLTAVGQPQELSGLPGATAIIEPGVPATSAVHIRMNLRDGDKQMPEVGSELVDGFGLGIIDSWIELMTIGSGSSAADSTSHASRRPGHR